MNQRRQALSAKANTGKFLGLPLVAFGAQKPVNRTVKWFCCCTSDCEYFYDLTGTDGGKERSKTSIYRHLRDHAIPKDENNGRVVNLDQTKCITAITARFSRIRFLHSGHPVPS